MNGGANGFRHPNVAIILKKELREVLRDRRAAFFTFIFPLFLYPVLFFLVGEIDRWDRDDEDRGLRIGLSGDFDDFVAAVKDSHELRLVPNVSPKDSLLLDDTFDLLAEFACVERDGTEAVEVLLRYDGATAPSKNATQRFSELLERYRMNLLSRRFERHGAKVDVGGLVTTASQDISASHERGEVALGKVLPVLLILLLITGGAFVAIDVVAGEKERGTLETLLVHPIPTQNLAAAKFLAVLVCSIVAVILNLVGMGLAHQFGWGPESGFLAELSMPPWDVLLVVGLMLLPMAVLTSSVLLAVSSVARSFREAQTYLVPVMIIGLLPSLLSAMPNVPLNAVTALLPVANIALAVRDTICGNTHWLSAALAFLSTTLYAALGVRWSSTLLKREETILGTDADPLAESATIRRRSRRAIFFATALLLVIYYSAPLLQSPDGPFGVHWGVAVTLWGVVLIPAIVYPRVCRLRIRQLWALKRPRLKDLLLTICAAPATAILIAAYMMLQTRWMPFSEGTQQAFQTMLDSSRPHPGALFFAFVLSPAICEEILWRGTFQGEMEPHGRPLKTLLLVALFFGLFHFSVYRFLPTAVLGGGLAGLRWRSGSIFPCILFHALYNGTVIFCLGPIVEEKGFFHDTVFHPATLVVAAGVLFLSWRWLGEKRSGITPVAGVAVGR